MIQPNKYGLNLLSSLTKSHVMVSSLLVSQLHQVHGLVQTSMSSMLTPTAVDSQCLSVQLVSHKLSIQNCAWTTISRVLVKEAKTLNDLEFLLSSPSSVPASQMKPVPTKSKMSLKLLMKTLSVGPIGNSRLMLT